MSPRIEAEHAGTGMLRTFIASDLAFMAENRNRVVETVEVALNARDADGSRVFGPRSSDTAVASMQELLTPLARGGRRRTAR